MFKCLGRRFLLLHYCQPFDRFNKLIQLLDDWETIVVPFVTKHSFPNEVHWFSKAINNDILEIVSSQFFNYKPWWRWSKSGTTHCGNNIVSDSRSGTLKTSCQSINEINAVARKLLIEDIKMQNSHNSPLPGVFTNCNSWKSGLKTIF